MKHSQAPGKAPFDNLRSDMLHEIHYPAHLSVTGFEALSIGESFNLFFTEMSTNIDKRLALLSKSIHSVDFTFAQARIKKENVLYVKNTSTQILTPEGYPGGIGGMMNYTKNATLGVYIIGSLKTEAARLYDWMKQVVKKGRIEQDFKWTIDDFSQALGKAENFIKNLPNNGRSATHNLGVVYTSFDEMWDTINTYNQAVKTIGARDAEVIAKTLGDVFEVGQLLVKKIRNNDIVLDKEAITDVEVILNRFKEFTNIAGVMMILLNELSAVFTQQVNQVNQIK